MDEHRVHRAGRVRAGLASRPASQAGPSSPLNCWTTREGRSRLSGPWVSGSRPWSGAHLLHHQETPLATPGTERDESALEEWHRLSSGSPRRPGSPLGTRAIVASDGRRRVHARRVDRRGLPAHGPGNCLVEVLLLLLRTVHRVSSMLRPRSGLRVGPGPNEDRICGSTASLQGSACQIVELSATAEPEAAEKQEQDDDDEQQFHGLPSFAPRLHFLGRRREDGNPRSVRLGGVLCRRFTGVTIPYSSDGT
jgi:hypothetical protein